MASLNLEHDNFQPPLQQRTIRTRSMHCWRPQKLLEHVDRQVAEARQFLENNEDNLNQEGRYDQAYSLLTEWLVHPILILRSSVTFLQVGRSQANPDGKMLAEANIPCEAICQGCRDCLANNPG